MRVVVFLGLLGWLLLSASPPAWAQSCPEGQTSDCAPDVERDAVGCCPAKAKPVPNPGRFGPRPAPLAPKPRPVAPTASSRTLGVLRSIPAGQFTMGSPSSEPDRDGDEGQVSVTISRPFLLMESEVTQGMWQAVMGSNPSGFSSCGSRCPVEQVIWFDAVRFANAVSEREGLRPAYRISGESVTWDRGANGYRLPTEAEWAWAARGGQSYVYAGSSDLGSVAWYGGNSRGKTQPVCGKRRNGYGLCDMSGNVWEWVWDRYGASLPGETDPSGAASGSARVYRGGSCFNDARYTRVAYRDRDSPSSRYIILGFRLLRPVP